MNLPNYFLADLPPEARLSGNMISEACQTLQQNRDRYLRGRSTHALIRTLSGVAADWLKPDYRFRQYALSVPIELSGFPPAILAKGLDTLFGQVTGPNLEALLVQDLGNAKRLNEFCATRTESDQERSAQSRGPGFLVHIAGGKIPNPTIMQLILGVLLRSAQFVKCSTGGALVPRLFAHSLYEADPKLGACMELATWSGGDTELESALFAAADCVTATGADSTLEAVRSQLAARTRFVGYGHRVSFGFVTAEALSAFDINPVLKRAAADVIAWNQLGCLSPHVYYVERSGRVSPEDFASRLAEELSREEAKHPRGPISDSESAAIATRRGFYEVRAAHGQETRVWASPNSTAWTVVYEPDRHFQVSCLNRFIYVKSVSHLQDALEGADSVRGRVSSVGLEASEDQSAGLASQLAEWGVTRICPLGQMQNPPMLWRHDGLPPLGDLVVWSDWERSRRESDLNS